MLRRGVAGLALGVLVAGAGLLGLLGFSRSLPTADAAAKWPSITVPGAARQGALLVAQVDPAGGKSCSLIVRQGPRRRFAQRLPGGEPYAIEIRIAPRAARKRWRLALRCDKRLSAVHRVKVTGKRSSGRKHRRLYRVITIKPLDQVAAQPPEEPIGPDEQGFFAGLTDTQDGEPSDSAELGAGDYDNARIADIALSELGRNRYTPGPIDHGQCKQSVNDWVNAASGGTQRLGGNYHSNYAAQGGVKVDRDAAVKGDIIQLHNPANERAYFRGMHTAVVVGHSPGSESFDVVDSNYQLDRVVRRHAYNPYAAARRYGLVVTIWRMGSIPAAAPPAATPPSAPAPPPPPAAPRTYPEQQGSRGVNTFLNPYNASGMGPRIQPYQWVEVSCKVYAPQIASANPDGYWYRIASAPWSNSYYSPANTFWNGDVPGQTPYTHNTDFNVPTC